MNLDVNQASMSARAVSLDGKSAGDGGVERHQRRFAGNHRGFHFYTVKMKAELTVGGEFNHHGIAFANADRAAIDRDLTVIDDDFEPLGVAGPRDRKHGPTETVSQATDQGGASGKAWNRLASFHAPAYHNALSCARHWAMITQ